MSAEKIILALKKNYPDAHCALLHSNPEELLVATVLSAQCTDERVNMVTPNLFRKYRNLFELAEGKVEDIEEIIRSTGFFRNKAKNIKALAMELAKNHQGKVPKDLEVLVALPGVGRKTANVVLGNSFGLATGVVVDTHVQRLSRRMGLSRKKTPVDIEKDLMKLVPKRHWIQFSHWLITHGRGVCQARKPKCTECFLAKICPRKT